MEEAGSVVMERATFPGSGLWVGEVIDKEAVVIGIKGSEYR